MKKRTALVIGGGGFIGSHLVDLLIGHGHKVIIVQRHTSPFLSDLSIEYVLCDINEINIIKNYLRGVDWVFHFAHTTLPQSSNRDPVHDVQSNVISSIALLQACVEHKVKRVIYASSGGTVYGIPQSDYIDERHSTNPMCSYGITKLMIEKYLELFYKEHSLDYRVLRISNPYGERQRHDRNQGVVSVFLNKMLRGEPIEIWGDGSVVRDYIYVKDVARAFYLAAQEDSIPERVFNIGSGNGLSLRELVGILQEAINREAVIKWGEKRLLDVPRNVLSIERAQCILGWKPLTSMQDGIAITNSYMQKTLAGTVYEIK